MDITKREKLTADNEHLEDNPKANLEQLQAAQAANAEEHDATLAQALRENWKAVIWSAIMSLTIVMEGYDLRYVPKIAKSPCDSLDP